MALGADLRVAAESALFVTAFSKLNLTGDNGVTYGLVRLVGRARALELLYLSPRLGAHAALAMGLVNRVVPDEEVLAAGLALSAQLATGPTHAYALIKEVVTRAETATFHDVLAHEELATSIAPHAAPAS